MTFHPELFFSKYERFGHWTQALLILGLIVTGFHVTGLLHWLDYELSARWHRLLALSLVLLWVFTLFWLLITGEWRQYIPTTEKILDVIHYYSKGIFDPFLSHPFKKTRRRKHNPLQRIAYLVLSVIISPLLLFSGALYAYYNKWYLFGIPKSWLEWVAGWHLAMAYAMACFVILHIYMAFTSKPATAAIKAMITGFVEVEDMDLDPQREYRLLVVEGDSVFALMIQGWLDANLSREGDSILPVQFAVTHVETCAAAVKVLGQSGFDLIVLDPSLPDSDGIATLRRIRGVAMDVPILVIHESADDNLQSRVIHEGAQDFLVKHNLSRRLLLRSFRFALERHWF
ncbi:MAG: cytochrome b/b6 domain-containing protein, partial [Magnetococcales bacterium]|nr:cytochrome b/b6 domain-containing protein [Magnetococcales bacterium]